MRIAIPLENDFPCAHFGRSNAFWLCDVEASTRSVTRERRVERVKGRCESVPVWLKQMGVTAVLCDGIGAVAQKNLSDLRITVIAGQRGCVPGEIAGNYLRGLASPRSNRCAEMEHRHLHCRQKRGEAARGE